MTEKLIQQISKMPLVAILRGITPDKAALVSDLLVEAGFCFMEVTLNSPNWQLSLETIRQRHGTDVLLGAGTVLSAKDVDLVKQAGGQVIISPNVQVEVIQRSKALGLVSIPGCYSPTECFTALQAGADILKIFPVDSLGVSFIKAVSAVLPTGTRLCPTGGITTENMNSFFSIGVFAAGIGSALYTPDKTTTEISKAATALVAAYRQCC